MWRISNYISKKASCQELISFSKAMLWRYLYSWFALCQTWNLAWIFWVQRQTCERQDSCLLSHRRAHEGSRWAWRKLKDEMGVIEMMIENDQSWQTNTHPQAPRQTGLAARPVAGSRESRPCQGSADRLHHNTTSCCTDCRYEPGRRSSGQRETNAGMFD